MVSIIIPVFNRAKVLGETIDSVNLQTYQGWELILVDDHSTDGSKTVANEYIKKDSRIDWVENEIGKKGACSARNAGLRSAKGKYIIFFDSDDIMLPHLLEQRVDLMERQNHLDIGVFPGVYFGKSVDTLLGRVANLGACGGTILQRFFTQGFHWGTHASIWKAEFLNELGAWNESAPAFQDWELNVRAISKGAKLFLAGETIKYDYCVRTCGSDRISSSWVTKSDEIIDMLTLAIERLPVSQKTDLICSRSIGYPLVALGDHCLRAKHFRKADGAYRAARRLGAPKLQTSILGFLKRRIIIKLLYIFTK